MCQFMNNGSPCGSKSYDIRMKLTKSCRHASSRARLIVSPVGKPGARLSDFICSPFRSCRVRAADHRVAVSWGADDRKNLEGSRDPSRLISRSQPDQTRADALRSPVIKGSQAL